jgi:phage FluMu protein gp41
MMTDEADLDQAAAKALRVQDLLDNEILTEAFDTLEKSYVTAWRATAIDDVTGREKLFLAINIVGKVRGHLASVVANGKLAEAELRELARVAERRKRFGIL